MPKDVAWQGKTVFTGVFKEPVTGPRLVRRLNIDGDGQGDLAGTAASSGRCSSTRSTPTATGSASSGGATSSTGSSARTSPSRGCATTRSASATATGSAPPLFEVTQPRVTCYRVGIRMDDPRIPALLVSHRRPGFYFRVLEEGEVAGGRRDRQGRLGPGADDGRRGRRAAVPPRAPASAAAPGAAHPRAQPRLAGLVPRAARGRAGSGNAGLTVDEPAAGLAGVPPADRHRDRPRERLGHLRPPRRPRRRAAPGRAPRPVPHPAPPARRPERSVLRNYSLSGPPGAGDYRISVKREHDGAASGYLHTPPRASATGSRSPRRAAPSSSTPTPTRRCC